MLINADFAQRAILSAAQHNWIQSPQPGVERIMLDRIGGERARATTLVRYAPGSSFPRHRHPAGEEILVLSGTFSEDGCDYPAGWYLRNAPGSSHQPYSVDGAIIFVKLGQMDRKEHQRVRINTGDHSRWRLDGTREICPLFKDSGEQVCLVRIAPHGTLPVTESGGAELLIIAGDVEEGGQSYGTGSWLRIPAGETLLISAGESGSTIYLKTGHLATARDKE